MSTPPLILAYAADADITTPRSRLWRWMWVLSTLPAMAVPVLDFYWSVSPLDVAREMPDRGFDGEWMLSCAGLTFFVAYPLVAWRLRLALGRRPGVWEARIAIIAALLCMAGPVAMIVGAIPNIFVPEINWSEGFLFFGILCGGVGAGGLIAWRCRPHPPAAADALMLGGYLANAVFCLYAFRDGPQIGYWFTVVACAIFLPQLFLLPLATRRRLYVT